MAKTLYRSKKSRIVAGICGGMGEYFDVDPIWFRILALVLIFGWGAGIILYLVLWLIIPEEPSAKAEVKSKAKTTAKKATKKKAVKKKVAKK